jgi:hypothetical protein
LWRWFFIGRNLGKLERDILFEEGRFGVRGQAAAARLAVGGSGAAGENEDDQRRPSKTPRRSSCIEALCPHRDERGKPASPWQTRDRDSIIRDAGERIVIMQKKISFLGVEALGLLKDVAKYLNVYINRLQLSNLIMEVPTVTNEIIQERAGERNGLSSEVLLGDRRERTGRCTHTWASQIARTATELRTRGCCASAY